MNEIMLIMGVLLGAGIYHLASQRNVVTASVQPKKRLFTRESVVEEVAEEKTETEPEIEKVLAEIKPPNIFDRRAEKEALARELAEQRNRMI